MATIKSRGGYTLVEVLMASALMVTLAVGTISTFNFALKTNQHNSMQIEIEDARHQIRTRIDCANTKAAMAATPGCYYPVVDSSHNVVVNTYNPGNEPGTATRFGVSILVRGNKCAADAATNSVPIDYKIVDPNTDTPKTDTLTKRTSGSAATNYWAPLFDSAPLCGSTASAPGNGDVVQMCPVYTSMVGYYLQTGQPACLVVNPLHSRTQISSSGGGGRNANWRSSGSGPVPYPGAIPLGCLLSDFRFIHGHSTSFFGLGNASNQTGYCLCAMSPGTVTSTGASTGTSYCGANAFYW